jgi:hypothetical protein
MSPVINLCKNHLNKSWVHLFSVRHDQNCTCFHKIVNQKQNSKTLLNVVRFLSEDFLHTPQRCINIIILSLCATQVPFGTFLALVVVAKAANFVSHSVRVFLEHSPRVDQFNTSLHVSVLNLNDFLPFLHFGTRWLCQSCWDRLTSLTNLIKICGAVYDFYKSNFIFCTRWHSFLVKFILCSVLTWYSSNPEQHLGNSAQFVVIVGCTHPRYDLDHSSIDQLKWTCWTNWAYFIHHSITLWFLFHLFPINH